MREPPADRDRRRAREFESFVAGAAGRLLHAATLLTGEPAGATPRAHRLLTAALAATYADWDRLRGDDPYDHARQQLATRFGHSAWHGCRGTGGVLGPLGPRARVIVVLRLYDGAGEEQTAALLGLPVEKVRAICAGAVATLVEDARRERTGITAVRRGRLATARDVCDLTRSVLGAVRPGRRPGRTAPRAAAGPGPGAGPDIPGPDMPGPRAADTGAGTPAGRGAAGPDAAERAVAHPEGAAP